jgi:adenine-specific DNA-methyltransferase
VPVLIADDAHSTVKTGASEDDHVLIEGDNLAALTMLQATHKGKVNVIYIDPPYNTGNQDFAYNDRFVDPEDSYRHSKWLSFMRPRLVLARELLTSDGVIFVSIDDHEQAYLRVLMDEVFGEQNFIANMIWRKRSRSNSASNVSVDTEYVLFYAKNISQVVINREASNGDFPLRDGHYEQRGGYRLNQLDCRLSYSRGLDYEMSTPYGPVYPGGSELAFKRRKDSSSKRDWNWRWSQPKVEWGLKNDFIVFKKTGGNVKAYYKMYEKVDNNLNSITRDVPYSSWIDGVSTSDGGNEIRNILEGSSFSFPKPSALIKKVLSMATSADSIVLDFFAGSGTTGQAVAELNKEDSGHRRAILVTNNFEQDGAENGIARSVTAVRMRRVLTGEDWADGKKHDPLPGNLRYYRVGFKALSDDADVFTGEFTAPGDIAGVIALAHGVHDVASPESLAAAGPALSAAVANGRAMVLTNGHGDRVLVYSDAVAVMNGDDEYEDVLAGFREWAGDAGTVYLASLDESDDDGVVYPLPYVRIVRRTVNGLERQGLLAREK